MMVTVSAVRPPRLNHACFSASTRWPQGRSNRMPRGLDEPRARAELQRRRIRIPPREHALEPRAHARVGALAARQDVERIVADALEEMLGDLLGLRDLEAAAEHLAQ